MSLGILKTHPLLNIKDYSKNISLKYFLNFPFHVNIDGNIGLKIMKIKLFTFFIGIFLLVSCYKEPGKIDVKAYQKSIKQQQFELGWINLPYTIKKNINEDKKKYKLISTKKVKNNTLLEILKPKTNSLYFDIDSISELSKDSKKIFRIKVLKTGNSNKFSGPLARQTILSHYEISCHSNK